MTDQPQDGWVVVRKFGKQVPMSVEIYAATLNPDPTPDPALNERKAAAARDLPASIRRLDALADPVSRAVLDLHARRPRFTTEWECSLCVEPSDMGDGLSWPCDTVEVVAGVHGIDLTDFWLLDRPADGSLDHPETRP